MGEYIINFIKTGELKTIYLILIILICALLISLLFFIRNKTTKSIYEWQKKLVYQCDKLIYYLAKFQEGNKEHKTNTYIMESLFELQNPDYIHHIMMIISKIEGLTASLNMDVVPKNEIMKVKSIQKRLKWKKFFASVLAVIVCLLVVLLIMILVRAFVLD